MSFNAVKVDPEELKAVAVHESGHAVMAIVQGISVRGVFFCYDPSKWESARGPLLRSDQSSFTRAQNEKVLEQVRFSALEDKYGDSLLLVDERSN